MNIRYITYMSVPNEMGKILSQYYTYIFVAVLAILGLFIYYLNEGKI